MLVFKDEDKAKELVKAGNELLQQYEPGIKLLIYSCNAF